MDLRTYFLQIYGEIDDTMAQRVMDELGYYMHEAKRKEEMIFFEEFERTIIITVNNDEWPSVKLYTLLKSTLRDTCHIFFPTSGGMRGWNSDHFNNAITGQSAKPLFENTKEFRKINRRMTKLKYLKNLILGKDKNTQ